MNDKGGLTSRAGGVGFDCLAPATGKHAADLMCKRPNWPVAIGLTLSICAGVAARASAGLIVPAFDSYPDSADAIYLDFDGDVTPNYGDSYHPGTTPAYDIDGDPNNFSAAELDNIHKIWMGVAEKYSPFNINVTTVNPGYEDGVARVVIGGSGSWAPAGSGGIAIEGSFANVSPAFPNLAFVFPGHLTNGFPRYVAEAAAHEAGHGFGLAHQSLYLNNSLVEEYNPGDADRAPIMGRSYFATRGMWWNGPTPDSVSNFQDDLKIISSTTGPLSNGFGYRADDHPNTPTAVLHAADALLVAPNFSVSASGVIEKSTDADFFNFVTAGGPTHLVADVAPFAPMLVVSSATPTLGESIDRILTPGSYKVGIFSAGNYGDLGQYSISGYIPEPASAAGVILTLGYGLLRRRRRGPHFA